jgi:hypothetical protein
VRRQLPAARSESPAADRDLCSVSRAHVAIPLRRASKAGHIEELAVAAIVPDDLEHRLIAASRPPTRMSEAQKALSEHPSCMDVIEVARQP